MSEVEVSLGFALFRLGLAKARMLAHVIIVQFILECHVCSLGHNALLLQYGEDSQGLCTKKFNIS